MNNQNSDNLDEASKHTSFTVVPEVWHMERIRELENELDKAKAANERNKSERNREALNAAEVDRLTRDRDDWRELYQRTKSERDEWKSAHDIELGRRHRSEFRRGELQSKLDAAEQRPTLDREAVHDILVRFSNDRKYSFDCATEDILALAPIPSWLGDVPDKPEAVKESDGIWKVDRRRYSALWSSASEDFRRDGYRRIALADAIDAEEAKRNAEDEQRIEEQAKPDAAENRPTLDREAVRAAHKKWMDEPSTGSIEGDHERLIDIMTALVPAAEQRPTLDREAVKTILFRNFQNRPPNFDRAEKELSALAFEAANAWPEWLGPRPEKPNAVRNSDDVWAMGRTLISADITPAQCDLLIARHINTATDYAAVKDAIESERAKRDDETSLADSATGDEANAWGNPPEVDRLAKLIWDTSRADKSTISTTRANIVAKAIKDAGWTPPESEAGNE